MTAAELVTKIGAHSILLQAGFLVLSVVSEAIKFGHRPVFGWLLFFSLLAGLVSFISGLAVALLTRRAKALGIPAASLVFAFLAALIIFPHIGFGV